MIHRAISFLDLTRLSARVRYKSERDFKEIFHLKRMLWSRLSLKRLWHLNSSWIMHFKNVRTINQKFIKFYPGRSSNFYQKEQNRSLTWSKYCWNISSITEPNPTHFPLTKVTSSHFLNQFGFSAFQKRYEWELLLTWEQESTCWKHRFELGDNNIKLEILFSKWRFQIKISFILPKRYAFDPIWWQ